MDAKRRFEALFQAGYAPVRRYAHHRGMGAADADDLVADVFAVAWRRLDQVPADDPTPWLLAVARNHWRNQLRRSRRDRELAARLHGADAVSWQPDADDDGMADLRRALGAVSSRDRDILLLVAWDGLSIAQVATVLGCSGATARVRLHRARSRLASALQGDASDRRRSRVVYADPE